MEDILEENDTLLNDTPEEVVETPLEEGGTPQSQNSSEVEKELQTRTAQKEHFQKKVVKLEAELAELKKVSNPTKVTANYDSLEVVKLAQALKDYSPEELEFIVTVAKTSNPQDIIAATNNDYVKTAIAAKREQIEKSKQIPSPSSPSLGSSASLEDAVHIAKDPSISDEELTKMTKKAFEEAKSQQKQRGAKI